MAKTDRHYHYEVQGYDDNANGRLNNVVIITIIKAHDVDHALLQAKNIIKKPNYRISRIWECIGDCYTRDKDE